MAIPNTGSLSGDQIDNEFPNSIDGGRPMKLSEYRGVRASKDGSVYNLPSAPNPIAYSDFRGVSYGYFIDVLIVGGGGGGGSAGPLNRQSGGGGGAGELRIIENIFVVPGASYTVTIGRGGEAGFYPNNPEYNSTTSRGFNGQRSGFAFNYAQGGFGGGSIINRDGKGQSNAGSAGGAGCAANTGTGSGGQVNESLELSTGRRQDGGDSIVYGIGAEGGGGGGSNSPGRTPESGGNNGEGGRGYDLDLFMGTANYRRNEPYNYSDPRQHRLYGNIINANQLVTINGSGLNDGFGIAGGGGGGRFFAPDGFSHTYVSALDGGGFGCFPGEVDNSGDQLRNARPRTGGGGGGGCTNNGAGDGGQGVVIVRYRGNTTLDSSNTGNNYIQRRKGNIGNTEYTFVIFGNPDGNVITTDPNAPEITRTFVA
jgi:hypothetical protein